MKLGVVRRDSGVTRRGLSLDGCLMYEIFFDGCYLVDAGGNRTENLALRGTGPTGPAPARYFDWTEGFQRFLMLNDDGHLIYSFTNTLGERRPRTLFSTY